jgi:hypothetical protein
VRNTRPYEARGGGIQDELVQLTVLNAHGEAPSVVVDGHNRALLGTAAEVLDAHASANEGYGSSGAEHHSGW